MKKLNHKGFILAETLVVTVFLMVIFSMLYSNFYPLIGEYERRETYDDVDGKYAVYWLKKLIEDSSYIPSAAALNNYDRLGFMRFECRDMAESDEKRETCRLLVRELEAANCDSNGNGCSIFITKYRIGGVTPDFKATVKSNLKRFKENCASSDSACQSSYLSKCVAADKSNVPNDEKQEKCLASRDKQIFDSAMKDYIDTLPDYSAASLNRATYRVIAAFRHKRDNNNYNSYATIEVNR